MSGLLHTLRGSSNDCMTITVCRQHRYLDSGQESMAIMTGRVWRDCKPGEAKVWGCLCLGRFRITLVGDDYAA